MVTTADKGLAPFAFGGFFREAMIWTVPVALTAAAVGWLVTRDVAFPISCLLGAAVDVATIVPVARAGATGFGSTAGTAAALFAVRLGVKGALLLAASTFPRALDLAGMAVGVLAYDTTLITVGAVVSARRTFGHVSPAAVESRRAGDDEGR